MFKGLVANQGAQKNNLGGVIGEILVVNFFLDPIAPLSVELTKFVKLSGGLTLAIEARVFGLL
jgi:hypothetical protein